MLPSERLRDKLITLDGKGYSAYKGIAGAYRFPRHVLTVDHVQPDPFAPPSLLRVQVDMAEVQLPPEWWGTTVRKMALEDGLARRFREVVRRVSRGRPPERGGDRRGGLLLVDAGGQEILLRTACRVHEEHVELRLALGLPAEGRKIQAKQAAAILLEELPAAVEGALLRPNLDEAAVRRHLEAAEDQAALVEGLQGKGLVAFVAEGAILPRESGISDLPLGSHSAVPFRTPEALAVTLATPHRGPVRGMGIPAGVTLIVGGGFHGKSTLLSALTRGIYPHLPGDGRELVAARPDLVKIRAEEGRRVNRVDISAFVGTLPMGVETAAFSTENASGSTSQAANVVEAIEGGARVLVIDEDSSATNFMIRDPLMQRLVPKALEPITPFVDQVRHLFQAHGISTVLVMGGSGDYFAVADTVILMDAYQPRVVTEEARRIAAERRDLRAAEGRPFEGARSRVPLPHGFNLYRDRRIRVDARGVRTITFGRDTIDLSAVEQIVDASQTRAIGDAIFYALERGYFDGVRTLRQVLDALEADFAERGLEALSSHEGHPGDYALPRRHEIAAAINRLRTLAVKQLE
ncbi:MAG TPA: ABC-ATPase domain-containing protein [bacterium]|nr:ABC-ATPase domain-containing protein [bacterium]